MSSLPNPNPRVSGGGPAGSGEDPSLGDALERVYGAGQALIVRRIDLLVEELAAQGRGVLAGSTGTILGAAAALVGWFLAVAGLVDWLDAYFPRFAVEIVVGLFHVVVGASIVLHGRRRAAAEASS